MENFLWNDEVPHYFSRHFYAYFFMEMHTNYTSLQSDYYGDGKGQTYDRKMAYRNARLQRPMRTLVSHSTGAFASDS